MTTLLTLLILTAAPQSPPLTDTVDIIERNHVHDAHGCRSFTQWIFWRWTGQRYEVVAWRVDKGHVVAGNRLRWMDGTQPREVRAVSFRETWTVGDPEVMDREITPVEFRRGLAATIPRSRKD
jgi:hypothetical protein